MTHLWPIWRRLYTCATLAAQISPLRSPPYPHMCTNSQHPAPGRCSLHISHPHSMALRRELLSSRRRSITWNRLTLEWVAASEVIDTTAIIIKQAVPIFLYATARGARAVAKTHGRQRLGCVRVKVFQQRLTRWLWKGKDTKHSWNSFPSNLFCLKRQQKKRCTK